MTGLPRKYAKMGFSKGWKAYRSSTVKTGGKTMARRRGRFSKRSRTKSHSGMNSLMNIAIGVVGAIAYEKFVSPMIPVANPVAHGAVDVAAGYALTKVNNSMAKSAGNAIMIINLFGIGQSLLGGTTSSNGVNDGW